MKIIYSICGLYNSGGMERIVTQKANYLADVFGYNVTIVTTDQKDRPVFFALSTKVKHVDLGINYGDGEHDDMNVIKKVLGKKMKTRQHFRKLNAFLCKEKADIVITTINNDLNLLLKIQDGSKKICEFHFSRQTKILEAPNALLRNIQRIRMVLWKRYFTKYDKFIVLTEEDKMAWGNLDNMIVIPNFVDEIPPYVSIEREKRVICVGRAVYQKGFDLMLDIWKFVMEKDSEWQLYIFGNGDKTALEDKKKKLGLSKSVHLMPATKTIDQEYDKSSIYALSSRYEGLPMVLLEAMSHGLPIVSFACPCGPKDVIKDSFGSIVENGDTKSFSNVLLEWMHNPEKLELGSKNAYSEIHKYTKTAIMKKWNLLFKKIMN